MALLQESMISYILRIAPARNIRLGSRRYLLHLIFCNEKGGLRQLRLLQWAFTNFHTVQILYTYDLYT